MVLNMDNTTKPTVTCISTPTRCSGSAPAADAFLAIEAAKEAKPEKFSDYLAQNRDLFSERAVLEMPSGTIEI